MADRRRLLRAKRPDAEGSTRKVHFRLTLTAAPAHTVIPKCIEHCLHGRAVDDYSWIDDVGAVDLEGLSNLYRIAPIGNKPPQALATVFGNSM